MPKNNVNMGAVLLAAGLSRRFGSPKQLALIQGQTMIHRSVRTLKNCGAKEIRVVINDRSRELAGIVEALEVPTVLNPFPERGLGSSIRAAALWASSARVEGLLIMTCDQPFISASYLRQLIFAFSQSPNSIIVTSYDSTFGIPVVFPRQMFGQLLEMDESKGAKPVLLKNSDNLVKLPNPLAGVDIDTPEELALLDLSQLPT